MLKPPDGRRAMSDNLHWLYHDDDMFRNAVQQAAAHWLGSTSTNFADSWLRETHRSDYEDLTGQHVDADSRDAMQSIAEKYRADAIAAQKERDAYRELCGRMRKMANQMLCMEVD